MPINKFGSYVPKISFPDPENRFVQLVKHDDAKRMGEWLNEFKGDNELIKVTEVNWVTNTHKLILNEKLLI